MSARADLVALEARFAALQGAEPDDLAPLRDLAERAWASRRGRPVWSAAAPRPLPSLRDAPASGRAVALALEHAFLGVALNPSGPRHFGWVPGGGTAASALGDYIAALTNAYAGYRVPSPAAVDLELALLEWHRGLVGLPAGASGDLCAGGSLANVVALHAATPRVDRALSGERSDGAVLPHDLGAIVYLSEERHKCLDKALRLIGHGGRVRQVRVDAAGRMDAEHLAALVAEDRASGDGWPWLVAATAGTTGTGAVDPLPAIADLCAAEGLWMHVDAAYGGFFALTDQGRERLSGVERADSVVLDPHKGLFQPYGLGVALVRDGRRLVAAHADEHAYIREDGALGASFDDLLADGSAMFRSPELSRPFRALRLWVALQVHGVAAFRAALDHRLGLASYAWTRLSEMQGVDVGPKPDLSIVPFRVSRAPTTDDEPTQEALVRRLRDHHDVFITSTRFRGRTWLRLAILCLQTRLEDVDAALDAIAEECAG